MTRDVFDLESTYVHLAPTGARAIPVGPEFWDDLISGKSDYPGRLAMIFAMTEDFAHWERHPAGEELVIMLSGSMDMILEEAGGERRVRLETGQAMLVPTGIWHRGLVVEPGRALFVTEGEGTDHKPIDKPDI